MTVGKHKCTGCKEYFDSNLSTWVKLPRGKFHDFECAYSQSQRKLQTIKKKRAKQKKQESAKKRENALGIKHQEKLTQASVNRYVRLRDSFYNRRCISCDKIIDYDVYKVGGACDAGHYKTQASHPEIRFNVNNINAECKHCNRFNSEHLVGMRVGIVERYGQERLDWLDGHHELKKYTIQDHKRIRLIFNKRSKRYIKN